MTEAALQCISCVLQRSTVGRDVFDDLYPSLCGLLDTGSQLGSGAVGSLVNSNSKMATDEEMCAATLLALMDLLAHSEDR